MGVDVLYEETEQSHVFAIRGTQPILIDLLRNLWFWPKSSNGNDSHAGYLDGWNHVEQWIGMASTRIGPDKPIIMTGHSAGGAIALIGGNELLNRGRVVSKIVTFGAPRAMDDNTDRFAWLKSVTTQYIHHRDPVPSWLGHTDYKHVKKHYLGKECGWWRQSLDYHGIDVYEDLM